MRTIHLAAIAAFLLALLAVPLLAGAQAAGAAAGGADDRTTAEPPGRPDYYGGAHGANGRPHWGFDETPEPSFCGRFGSIVLLLMTAVLVLYYVFMIRAVIHALRAGAGNVLLVFAFLGLLPTPFTWVLGVCVMIVWRCHRRDLAARRGVAPGAP